jgi:LysM repeat protein
MNARIGIDPQGGTDPFAPEVVWSNAINPLDAYYLLTVEAVAEGPMITVYTYSAPDIPALNLDMYWDDASLVVITGSRPSSSRSTPRPTSTRASDASAASSQPDSSDQSGASPPPTTSLEPPLPTQPAQPDGSVIHVVQRGETLGGIARAYGISVEELMHLNGLTSYLIFAGNELLIRQAPTSTPTARPTRTPIPTVEPEDEQPEDDSTGQLCVTAFDDTDGDGLQGEDEGPLPGTVISLGGEADETYTTDDRSDTYCFEDLPPGEYDVSVEPPEGYALAADPDQQVTLEAGGQVEAYFALRFSEEGADPRESAPDSGQNNSSALQLRVGALLVMALAGGLLAFVVAFRATRDKPTE